MAVNLLWILFRAETVTSAILFIKKLCCLSSFDIRQDFYKCFDLIELMFIENRIPVLHYLSSAITGFNLWIFILGAFFTVLNLQNSKEAEFRPTFARALAVVIFIVWSIVSFAGISTFLYFDF